jgi:hypothetical protein
MVAMDLARFAVVISIPTAFAPGRLSFVQLLIVSVTVAAADIAFRAAGGACLKALVRPADLLASRSGMSRSGMSRARQEAVGRGFESAISSRVGDTY